MKRLIVNADDFGNTSGVNRGIIYGFKNGIITSTSLMVKRPEAEEAAKLAKENPGLGWGYILREYILFDQRPRSYNI
ncbi:ChbG/HpnK family deacetylase [Candidatus Gottesmanbacteria bacterium]|nr:ChbG/HpnK family deacetylase [Candidatus Gottesmanbacteria bacterium]